MSLKDDDAAVGLLASFAGGDLTLLCISEAGELDPGELALLGGLLSELGDEITAQARKDSLQIMEGRRGYDHGVVFEHRAGGTHLRVDTGMVRKLLDPLDSPQFFKEVRTKDSVAIKLPGADRASTSTRTTT